MNIIKAVILLSILSSLTACDNSSSGTNYSSSTQRSQSSENFAKQLTNRCAIEAGIPLNKPNHVITQSELNKMTSCVDRVLQ